MGDYFDNYKERMRITGTTFSERMNKDAKKVYDKYMQDKGTSTAVIDLNEYQISMIHDKENEVVEQYIVLADIDSPFTTGTVFEVEDVFYIVIYEEETRHKQYFKGYARKSTNLIKIKTELGTECYRVYVEGISGINMKSAKQGNIVVDENKASGKVVMQKCEDFKFIQPLKTRFFIGDDVYKVTGKDSLKDMGYLTVQKDLINTFKDNKVLGIANYYEDEELEVNYYISATLLDGVTLEIDTEYEIENVLDIQIKDYEGKFVSKPYTIDVIATEININGSKITPLVLGNIDFYLTLDDDKNSRTKVTFEVLKNNTITYTVDGEDELVWSEDSTYTIIKFLSDVEIPSTWTFTIEENASLVDLVIIDANSCTVTAKESGAIGDVILLGTNGLEEVRKRIKIATWW